MLEATLFPEARVLAAPRVGQGNARTAQDAGALTGLHPALPRARRVTLDRTLSAEEEATLVEAARATELEVLIRVPSPDRRLLALLEPGRLPPLRRFAVLRRLKRSGLRPGVFIAPIVAGIHDNERDLLELFAQARSAGASSLQYDIEIPSSERCDELRRLLARSYPRVAARYEVHVRTCGRDPCDEIDRIAERLRRLSRRFQIPLRDCPERLPPPVPLQRRFPFVTGT